MADPRWCGTLGAALCALVGLGWQADLAGASALTATERRFDPDPALAALYDGRFAALVRAYANNRGWFRRLSLA
jgi:L-xylulokinase